MAIIALPTPAVPFATTPTRIPTKSFTPGFPESVEVAVIVAFVLDNWLVLDGSSNPGTITNLAPAGGTKENTFPITSPSDEILPAFTALAFAVVWEVAGESSTPGAISLPVFIWIDDTG